MSSELEDIYSGAPVTSGGSGNDQGSGGGRGGDSIGTLVPSGNAAAPKRRGRPPSSARIPGGNPTFTGGTSKAASEYLRATGIGTSESEAADGDTGRGDIESESD